MANVSLGGNLFSISLILLYCYELFVMHCYIHCSGRSAHSETLLSLIVNIFKKSTDEWSRILASDILPNEGKAKSSRSKPAVQKEVGCLLITAVMRALDPESKERYVCSNKRYMRHNCNLVC